MNKPQPTNEVVACGGENASAEGRRRLLSIPGEPLFIAAWEHVLMIHYEVELPGLQRLVPFELDLYEGRAYVSLVAFTMRGMRPRRGGRVAAWFFKPIATHRFLNVRTYVRHGGEAGIYFLAEWLSNLLSVLLGPTLFGLPYRHGKLNYVSSSSSSSSSSSIEGPDDCHPRILTGRVEDASSRGVFAYRATLDPAQALSACRPDSRDEWLMERYTAFTHRAGHSRYFRVWHPPWPQVRAAVEVTTQALLNRNWPLFLNAHIVGANFSPGEKTVWMGRPHPVSKTRLLDPTLHQILDP